MNADHEADAAIYTVVVNREGQFSIWPSHRDVPPGWDPTARSGRKDECLAYIESAWTDMRPHRRRGQAGGAAGEPPAGPGATPGEPPVSRGPSLVERLASGRHPVEAAILPGDTASALREALGRGHVRIRFPQTRGGTELVLRLDRAASRMPSSDVGAATATVHLEGVLTLDQARVRCVVDLDPTTLRGEGHLAPVVDR